MQQNKLLSFLGLAVRARKVVLGEHAVLDQIKHNQGTVLFLASDAGQNIKDKINNKAKTYDCTVITQFTKDELSHAMGKKHRALVLIADKGFSDKMREYNHS